MIGALDMAEHAVTGSATRKCHGTTDMGRNAVSSSLDAKNLLRVISNTVNNALDDLAEVYAFEKEKAKTLWARTSGQGTKEDSFESCPSADLAAYPTEILVLIAGHCDKGALWSLCLTARRFVQPARQYLYRDVDLTTHARGLVRNASGSMVRSDSLHCRNFPPAILQKQQAFIRTLDVHPEYKLYVHRLWWTILPSDDNFTGWYCQDGVWRFMGSCWQVLGSLTNLKGLDLFDLSQPDPTVVSPTREDAPVVQMPHLRRLFLGGCIHPKVGAPLLLHLDLAKLTVLYLNNVFMQRPLHDHLDEIVMKHLEGSTITASSHYNGREGGRPIVRWDTYAQHGPELLRTYEKLVRSKTYLQELQQCRSLKALTFETHSNKCMREYGGPLPAYLNALGYLLCGMILERNSQSLTHFHFRHGTDNSPSHVVLDPALVTLVNRHISWRDFLFRTYIYSSICRHEWPAMQSVVLTGIDSGQPGFPAAPPEFRPIPAPFPKLDNHFNLGVYEGILRQRIRTAIGPSARLACVSESRVFDPFEMPKVQQTEPVGDGEGEEAEQEEEEADEEAEEEDGDGAEDEEGWETESDADADAEEYEHDDDSDSVEEIGQAEFEQSQQQAAVE
ncbi:MAG: hypothetical protein OHK93_003923 [Ramalina farinacea]|uniref:Uncharacterized protein n=1 Tax=Ramalina farinacea TaxID=258253 RepID=A0AA43QI35_9LECA|nr:hypothetical protein [Ramalina farinacea]